MGVSLAVMTAAFATSSIANPINLHETVEAIRLGANGKKWRVAFDASAEPDHVRVGVRIRLVPGSGLTSAQLGRLADRWEKDVEQLWNGRFALRVGETVYPIDFDIEFDHLEPHHTAIVRNEASSRVDQLNWSRWSTGAVIAHEVGHMLGAYDEYRGGGQDPENPRVEPGSLMGAAPTSNSDAAERHLEIVVDWARSAFLSPRVAIVKID